MISGTKPRGEHYPIEADLVCRLRALALSNLSFCKTKEADIIFSLLMVMKFIHKTIGLCRITWVSQHCQHLVEIQQWIWCIHRKRLSMLWWTKSIWISLTRIPTNMWARETIKSCMKTLLRGNEGREKSASRRKELSRLRWKIHFHVLGLKVTKKLFKELTLFSKICNWRPHLLREAICKVLVCSSEALRVCNHKDTYHS